MNAPELAILGALWAQGALTLVLLSILGRRRVPLITEKRIALGDIALDSSGWPEHAQKASSAFNNQFQLPVLWAIGLGMALYLGAGWVEAVLAWVFLATRIVHAGIHVTSNHVMRRFAAYVAGFAVLAILWLVLLGRIILMAAV